MKQHLVKHIAVLMALCYILSPLHLQVGNILHRISHELDMPTYVLSHSESRMEHHSYHHFHDHETHQHHLIDLVKTLLKGAGQDHLPLEKSSEQKLELDKHLSKFKIRLTAIKAEDSTPMIRSGIFKVLAGHPELPYYPPKSV